MKRIFFHILILLAVSILTISKNALLATEIPPDGSIEGVYSTDFGEMTLYLNGNHVSGTYKYKGGKVDGILNGNSLTGTWTQDNGRGRIEFNFSADFSSFTGKWSYNNNEPSSKWNGTKTQSFGSGSSTTSTESYPSAHPIEGTYTTDFQNMTLSINGSHVTGTYKHAGGKVDGTLNGNRLRGTWTQTNGHGKLEFIFNSDFSSFTGKWGYNDSAPSSKWNGSKIGTSSSASISRPSSSPSESPSNKEIEGTYTTDFQDMTLSISGNHVTGTYKHAGGKVDGTLNGNRLTGTWTQTNGRGKLEFIFNGNFSSFTGKWGYNEETPNKKWNGTKK